MFKNWIPAFAGMTMFIWLAWGTWHARPNFLSYFNEAFGGPSRGYTYVTDSNVDWGQGLKMLGKELSDDDRRAGIYLSYFGVGDPHYYGIRYLDVGSDSIAGHRDDTSSSLNPTRFAISVTNLQGTYYADPRAFAWLLKYHPVKRIANSIFLYDFSREPEALSQLKRMRS